MNAAQLCRCDECGRDVAKIERNHHGTRYCATCYARTFKRRTCPKCGELARLPKNEPDAICRRCELAKPCARCGKSNYAIGKVTPYGPVCNACSPYFRPKESCEACGALSGRLSRVSRFEHDTRRLCPKCARADHETCSACGRYRLLIDSPPGKRLCRICLEKGQIPCSACDELMPAGRGKICDACYWKSSLQQRVKLDQAALATTQMRVALSEFGLWLKVKVGPRKAALSIHRYLSFFLQMEAQWASIPSYASLLGYFSAEGLRRVRLPMQWLREARGIEPDPIAREEDSERRRITNLLATFPKNTWATQAINDYHDKLTAKAQAGSTSVRSIRLALRPAVTLLLAANEQGNRPPDQAALDQYLLETPGQKAAITGFIHFLQTTHKLDLIVRTDDRKVRSTRRCKLEKEIIAMATHPQEGEAFKTRWLIACLEYFHKIKVGKRTIQNATVNQESDGFCLETDGLSYFLPRWDTGVKRIALSNEP